MIIHDTPKRSATNTGLLLLGHLRSQAFLLLPELGRELGAEILRLEHLSNLDHRLFAGYGIGTALDPLDRLFLRLDLPQPEAGDQLLCLGKRPIDDRSLRAGEADARALRARLEPFAREQHAGLRELFVELSHVGKKFLVREDA